MPYSYLYSYSYWYSSSSYSYSYSYHYFLVDRGLCGVSWRDSSRIGLSGAFRASGRTSIAWQPERE